MGEPVILEAVRTPIGKRNGALREVRPDALYAHALNALVRRAGLEPHRVEDVITGCVTQAGEQGANVGRLAVLLSDLPETVPAVTLNRMCGSSQQAIHFAAQAVAAGDARYVIAGGVESMTRAPMFSDIGGGFERLNPDLFARYELVHQGESAERIALRYGLTREALDAYGYESHRRAAAATRAGHYAPQLVPVEGLDAEGRPFLLEHDEGIRFAPDLEKMRALPPAFRPDGRVTAGNSSQISDGAAAVLIGDRAVAEADGFRPRARFRSRVVVAGDPTLQLLEVIPATRRALERAGLTLADIDVIEINEAFASVVLAWAEAVGADLERVNPAGGAIAHGHPLGATGAVLMTKLVHALEQRDGRFGLQVMCIGHGMATATVIERL
ncbi:thiolase family protein [Marinithermus hydrothermalis]|uniref:Acetyl-CoA acetyltransferase n=1 Tax=Marinithermus hydrothermalis (strain DSM 14884 / JCM 11576 / T1) TaxID=869210 RepID=F2NKP3_MARHT|nr:thiolase family protein [Marinithermus hydrothermalis]AEB10806.1 acetyl-CoA acetyltransferase [Marinithermus hydrothermalis DSM 14884]